MRKSELLRIFSKSCLNLANEPLIHHGNTASCADFQSFPFFWSHRDIILNLHPDLWGHSPADNFMSVMEISAKDVAELRRVTGAGMMDCKKALGESNGDFEGAIEILRKKGQKVSASRSDRNAKEGTVFAKANEANNEAVMIELNCETDFVALNKDFQTLGNDITEVAFSKKPASLDALKALTLADGRAILDHLSDAMGKIGEKIDVRTYHHLTADKIVTYIHPGARVGVLVAFEGKINAEMDQVGKDIAMQIAAMKPIAVDKDGISQEVIDKEISIRKEILKNDPKNAGKPDDLLEKIVLGSINKYFQESTLLNQEFVKDSSKTVAQYIKEKNPDVKVKAFHRVQLGEA